MGEEVSALKIVCVILIGAGTFLMIQKKETEKSAEQEKKRRLLYACLSAVFASLTSILGKIGIEGLNSNLGTAIRTAVVLLMAWIMVFAKGKQKEIGRIDRRNLDLSVCRDLQQAVPGSAITKRCRTDLRAW